MANMLDEKQKADLILRLKRVEGQLRGIQSMLHADEECAPIAQQMAAARRALDKVFFQMVACAMEQTVSHPNARERSNIARNIGTMLSRFG